MDNAIADKLIDEAITAVADGTAQPSDKIIVVFAAKWSSDNSKTKRSRAAEAFIPVCGVSVVAGIVVGLVQVLGLAS